MEDLVSLVIALAAIGFSIYAIRINRRAKAIREQADRTAAGIYRRTAELYRSVGVGPPERDDCAGSARVDALAVPVAGHEKCQVVLGRAGVHRVWRVECGYCGLVTEFARGYWVSADLAVAHLGEKHGTLGNAS